MTRILWLTQIYLGRRIPPTDPVGRFPNVSSVWPRRGRRPSAASGPGQPPPPRDPWPFILRSQRLFEEVRTPAFSRTKSFLALGSFHKYAQGATAGYLLLITVRSYDTSSTVWWALIEKLLCLLFRTLRKSGFVQSKWPQALVPPFLV